MKRFKYVVIVIISALFFAGMGWGWHTVMGLPGRIDAIGGRSEGAFLAVSCEQGLLRQDFHALFYACINMTDRKIFQAPPFRAGDKLENIS